MARYNAGAGSVVIEWIEVTDSDRVSAIAYDAETERILVCFKSGGTEWQYHGCPPVVWEQFSDPATSKGRFIYEQLNTHTHGPLID